jgi:basic membrane protein A
MADVDTDANYEKDTEVITDGYFHESEFRSAPYFDIQIDGITLLNTNFG